MIVLVSVDHQKTHAKMHVALHRASTGLVRNDESVRADRHAVGRHIESPLAYAGGGFGLKRQNQWRDDECRLFEKGHRSLPSLGSNVNKTMLAPTCSTSRVEVVS